MLTEQRRSQLDGIVQQATANNESPETIQVIVDDFKGKYENEQQEEPVIKQTQEEMGVIGRSADAAVESFQKISEQKQLSREADIEPGERIAEEVILGTSQVVQPAAEAIGSVVFDAGKAILDPAKDVLDFLTQRAVPNLRNLIGEEKVAELQEKADKNISNNIINLQSALDDIDKTIIDEVMRSKGVDEAEARRRVDVFKTGLSTGAELGGALIGAPGIKKAAKEVLDVTGEAVTPIAKQALDVAEDVTRPVRVAINDRQLERAESALQDTIGRIIQGETSDIKAAMPALQNIDLGKTKTFKDLSEKLGSRQSSVTELQDELLRAIEGKFGLKDTEEAIQTALGVKKVNYVDNAIKDILDTLEQTGEFKDLNKDLFGSGKSLGKAIDDIQKGDADLLDLNNIARYYNGQFRNKIYTKKGDAKDSIQAARYEGNRVGVKEFVRDKMPDEELKQLDREYGNIAQTNQLVDKLTEQANKLEQKLKSDGLGLKLVRGVMKVADTVTLGASRGVVNLFRDSNVGNKVNNILDIQEELAKNLRTVERLSEKLKNAKGKKEILDAVGESQVIKTIQGKLDELNEPLPEGQVPKFGKGSKSVAGQNKGAIGQVTAKTPQETRFMALYPEAERRVFTDGEYLVANTKIGDLLADMPPKKQAKAIKDYLDTDIVIKITD